MPRHRFQAPDRRSDDAVDVTTASNGIGLHPTSFDGLPSSSGDPVPLDLSSTVSTSPPAGGGEVLADKDCSVKLSGVQRRRRPASPTTDDNNADDVASTSDDEDEGMQLDTLKVVAYTIDFKRVAHYQRDRA